MGLKLSGLQKLTEMSYFAFSHEHTASLQFQVEEQFCNEK